MTSSSKEAVKYPDNTVATYSYDLLGRLESVNDAEGQDTAYGYDATNRMVLGANAIVETSAYNYNGLGFLVENTWTVKKNAYGYADPAAPSGDEASFMLPAPVVGAIGNGNQTTVVAKNYVLDYASPLKNAIMEAETGGLTYRYTYGIEKISAVVYGIASGAGNMSQTFSYPNGAQGVVKLWYHHDRLGSVDYLTDNVQGHVASYVTYDDWGALTAKAVIKLGARELDLVTQYTVHPYDPVLGIYFAQARMYDAATSRWLSMDQIKGSVANPQSLIQSTFGV